MNNGGFITYLFETTLREVFITKADMARTLDVTKRALQYNFKELECRKGGSIACENLFLYCLDRDILVMLYDRYRAESDSLKRGGMQIIRPATICRRPLVLAA